MPLEEDRGAAIRWQVETNVNLKKHQKEHKATLKYAYASKGRYIYM